MSKNNAWGSLLKSYYSNKAANKHKNENAEYCDVLDAMYDSLGDKKAEEPVELGPAHIVFDDEVEKYVEEHIVDESEQIIETEIDAYDAAVAHGGRPIELQEIQDELEEFKRLNKIEELHENNESKSVELEPNEVIVTEQPTETKVKKVKVSKPKAPKKAGRPKTKK